MDEKDYKGRTFCLLCGRKIKIGRSDKVFCSDRCRSMYHYQRSRGRSVFKSRVLGMLEKNYDILDSLIMQGVTAIPVEEIEMMGFRKGCATGVSRRGRLQEFWCFDIRYFMSSGRLYNLRRPLEIMKMLS